MGVLTLSRRILTAAAFVLAAFSLSFGQILVKSEQNGTMSAEQINEMAAKSFAGMAPPKTARGAELHKITYTSLDANSKPTQVTGLVVLPVGGASKGLVVYCHGTTVDRKRSPSRYRGEGEAPETVEAIAAFASGDYAVILPDYIGLGDHKGAHPYPLSKVNARSGVDMIQAARKFASDRGYSIGSQLYISGYSEGGGVAMALTQSLQALTGPMFNVTASAPASGPYDLSGVTREFMMQETGEQTGFVLRLYLLSYATHYLNKQKGIKLNTFYKPALANALGLNYRLNPTDEGVIKNIGLTTTLMRSKNMLSNVLQPGFLRDMKANRASNPFVRMLQENNTYDWTPTRPMLMIYVDKDFVVSPENTEKTYQAMRRRGVTDRTMRKLMLPDTYDHLTGIAPAMAMTRAFFDGGFDAVPEAK
jgi:pimeloyl-ACP methyl ester carboxylesterase